MTAESAKSLYDDGLAAFRRGDNEESRRLNQEAIDAAAQAGAGREEALGYIGLSRVAFRDSDYAAALEHAGRAEELATAAHADDIAVHAVHMRAEITRAQGDYAASVPLYEYLLKADESSGNSRGLSMEQGNLASVLIQVGDLAPARQHLLAAKKNCTEDLRPYLVLAWGGLLARDGDAATALRLLGAVQAHLASAGEVLDPAEQLEFASHLAAAGVDRAPDSGGLSLDDAMMLLP